MSTVNEITLRQLATLVAVVNEGTYSRAATRVGFTQSAVSQQIAALEKSLNLPVFDRPSGPKPVELTPAGRLLLDYARATLEHAADMDEQLDRLRRGITGYLIIGAFQSVSSRLLPNILTEMHRELPDVDLQVTETDDQERLVRYVIDDEMDFAFTIDHRPDPRVVIDVLGHDPYVVIAPTSDAPGTAVSLKDLSSKRLVGHPHDNTCQLMLDERMNAAGLRPEYAYRLSDNAALQSLVRSGLGWAVMPALAVDTSDPRIAVVTIDPPIAPRTMQLIRRADHTLPPAADTFARITHAAAAAVLAAEDETAAA